MHRRKRLRFTSVVGPVLFLIVIFFITPAQSFEPGKTYDKNNWQEIKELLPPSVLEWVKKGDFILKTGELNFKWAQDDSWNKATRENKGKYDIDDDGVVVDKSSGKPATFIYGFPFHDIDLKDPKVGAKISENGRYNRYHSEVYSASADVQWIGTGGLERKVVAASNYLYYLGRSRGPLPNPNNFLQQDTVYVASPFDLRGTVQMSWQYNDARETTAFAYVPMLRRVRRVSAASRSDPFLGSDLCTDDTAGFGGKNASLTWKFIGEQTLLVPVPYNKEIVMKRNPNGSFEREFQVVKKGYEVPGWTGAPWAPTTCTWVARPHWIVEAFPKDPYYAYGRQIYYIDKDAYNFSYKLIYDRAGEYWKTLIIGYMLSRSEDKSFICNTSEFYMVVDDRTNHSTFAALTSSEGKPGRISNPPEVSGPHLFTTAYLLELSK
ncbi:MAG: DUF1329 domain-containing protein [Candidatus Hodarchaeota archaeon]